MISFRDKTFCPFHIDCKHAATCDRALTDEVVAAAVEWWKPMEGEPAIAQFTSEPVCFEPEEPPVIYCDVCGIDYEAEDPCPFH